MKDDAALFSELIAVLDQIVSVVRQVQVAYRIADRDARRKTLAVLSAIEPLDHKLYALRKATGLELPEQLKVPPQKTSKFIPAHESLGGSGLECSTWGGAFSVYPKEMWFHSMRALRSEAELRLTMAGVNRPRRGGRRPLEDSKPLKFAVYLRINQTHRAGEPYLTTVRKLKSDKDFMAQVQDADLKLDTKLVRNAVAFFDQRERDQACENQETPQV